VLTPLDRLTDQDTQILKLESGNVRGHTCKLVILEPREHGPAPGVEELRERIATRLDRAPRFRRRLSPTPLRIANPVWIDDEAFDIAKHVRAVPSGGAVDRERLDEIVAGLMSERLDRARPLWALDVVEQLEDGSTALIWRIHHCMADGVTVVKLGAALLWDEEPQAAAPEPAAWQPERGCKWPELLVRGVGDRMQRAVRGAANVARTAASPRRWREQAGGLNRDRSTWRRELARTAAPSSLDRRIGPARRVAFASVPLAELKRIGKAHGEGITINDVVLTVVGGGVRAWLERHHESEGGIRVQVPVSLHHHDAEGDAFGNRDSYFFVDLPVAEPDAVRRLLAINRETADRKRHHDAETMYHLGLHRSVARWALSPHVFTFNVSNVPGPREAVFVRGARVRALYSLAEVAQHHALRVSVISAAGTMFFAFCADRDAVDDLDTITRGLDSSIEELLASLSGDFIDTATAGESESPSASRPTSSAGQ
jgi:diacylglycerol O-acyltransferase / wax synthase